MESKVKLTTLIFYIYVITYTVFWFCISMSIIKFSIYIISKKQHHKKKKKYNISSKLYDLVGMSGDNKIKQSHSPLRCCEYTNCCPIPGLKLSLQSKKKFCSVYIRKTSTQPMGFQEGIIV